MAQTVSFTCDSDTYGSTLILNATKGDYLEILYSGLTTVYGVGNEEIPAGCTATQKGTNTNVYKITGTLTGYGLFNIKQKKWKASGTTTSGRIDLSIYTTFYQNLYFNANGGSGAPSKQQWSVYAATFPSAGARTMSSTKPIRTNYTFQGWADSASATSPNYSAGGSITLSYSESTSTGKTIYAVWYANWYAVLNYDANGGTEAPDSQFKSYTQLNKPSAHTFVISDEQPTKEGKVFLGWSTDAGATTPTYQPSDNISVEFEIGSAGGTTLYAVWGDAPSGATMKVNDGGTWKDAQVFVNQGGAWGQPAKVYGNKDGTWKEGA